MPLVGAVHSIKSRLNASSESALNFVHRDVVRHLRAEGVLAWPETLRPNEPDALRLGIISRRTTEDSIRLLVDRLSEFVAERS